MTGYVDDIFHACTLVKRVARHLDKDYENDSDGEYNYLNVISNHREVKQMKDQLFSRVTDVMTRANKLKGTHMDYAYLWTDSRTEYMHYFLTYSRQLTNDEVELIEEEGEKAVKKQYPGLELFKEQIDFYEGLHDQLKNIENIKILQLWFRTDMRPFKQSLLNNIKRWSYAFKKHLTDHVVKSLADLNNFIEKADEGLMQQVQKETMQVLLK
jgi:dynein heavy chain